MGTSEKSSCATALMVKESIVSRTICQSAEFLPQLDTVGAS